MSIAPGTQVGPYQVTSTLGEGGMGVVYRARDPRLQRDVALKVLPDHFSHDPDRLGRFQREAQVLASLNHPHIAQIYGLEQSGNSSCIIMELVEGETLADRLKRGPFPVEEAVQIARQIAGALEAAHERGIVHRDLKPANIKRTPGGDVKVLDFGLAKSLGKADIEFSLSSSPTMMSGSMTGVVMGTAAYMSPEQARGKAIDARTDIWAFGCVLYEMLTGRQAFTGETATDIIAKVLEGSINWNVLPAETPPVIRMLLEETLRKDPKQRLQHVGDTRLFLNRAHDRELPMPDGVARPGGGKGWWVAAAMSIALAVTLVPAAMYFLRVPAPAPEMILEMPAFGIINDSVISSDGRNVAYLATVKGKRSIWVRPLGSLSARELLATDNANPGLFWSPDNHTLGFTADRKLKKIDISGGPPIELSNLAVTGGPGTWNREGTILFGGFMDSNPSILRLSSGGEVTKVAPLDPSLVAYAPQFLPDGKHFLYLGLNTKKGNEGTVYVASLDSKEQTRLMTLSLGPVSGLVRYAAPGYLLFLSNGTLLAQPFDGELTGEPVAIAEGVGGFSTSDTGVLVYQKGAAGVAAAFQQLQWFDRKGNRLAPVGEPSDYISLELSPNGHRAAVTKRGTAGIDIWIVDLERGIPGPVTFNSRSAWPVWSPDASSIIFSGGEGAIPNMIYQKSSASAGAEQTIFAGDEGEGISTANWSDKSQHLVIARAKTTDLQNFDIWMLPMDGDKKPVPYIQSPKTQVQPQVSPDGRWIAYTTDESGMFQVVVESFPDRSGGKTPVTANGGMEPRWSRDGSELYYLTLDGKLMAVPVKTDSGFHPRKESVLFQTPLVEPPQIPFPPRYDVRADGLFLMMVPVTSAATGAPPDPSSPASITAIVNWTSALPKK